MSVIIINGKTYTGKNVNIVNGKIIIDGKATEVDDGKVINITINGSPESVSVDACTKLEISGDVGEVKTSAGDVVIKGNVAGNVRTMSGNVKCSNISGSVSTMSGDIIRS